MKSSPRKQVKSSRKATAGKDAKAFPGLFPIVGIGASAGGLEAFSELLRNLPEKTGMAFVLVQHLDPKHNSGLPEILARTTKIPVTEVIQGVLVASYASCVSGFVGRARRPKKASLTSLRMVWRF
jgi:two-component system, chemotaxis family, CheB/CheR fusion protein